MPIAIWLAYGENKIAALPKATDREVNAVKGIGSMAKIYGVMVKWA